MPPGASIFARRSKNILSVLLILLSLPSRIYLSLMMQFGRMKNVVIFNESDRSKKKTTAIMTAIAIECEIACPAGANVERVPRAWYKKAIARP